MKTLNFEKNEKKIDKSYENEDFNRLISKK